MALTPQQRQEILENIDLAALDDYASNPDSLIDAMSTDEFKQGLACGGFSLKDLNYLILFGFLATQKSLEESKVYANSAAKISILENGIQKTDSAKKINFLSDFKIYENGDTADVSLDFSSQLSENGFQKLPNGLIIQWGTVDYATRPTDQQRADVGFPIAFSHSCLNVQLTRKMSQHSINGDGNALLVSATKNGFSASLQSVNSANADLRGFTWLAIGY